MRTGPKPIYPWRTMKVGDEFKMKVLLSSARSMASQRGIDLRKAYQVRQTDRGIVCKRTR